MSLIWLVTGKLLESKTSSVRPVALLMGLMGPKVVIKELLTQI